MSSGKLKITVRFFAYFRELFKANMKQIELDTGSKVKDLVTLLCESESQKTELIEGDNLKQHIMIMINGHHLMSLNGFDTLLEDGDTVAIFPFLGGG